MNLVTDRGERYGPFREPKTKQKVKRLHSAPDNFPNDASFDVPTVISTLVSRLLAYRRGALVLVAVRDAAGS